MVKNDAAYFRHRAEVELALAERAELPQVASAHRQLATAYLDRVAEQQPVGPAPGGLSGRS